MNVADPFFQPASWRELIAIGVVANDFSARTIARCAGIRMSEVIEALGTAENEGLLKNGIINALDAVQLVAELPPAVVAEVHTVVARHLLSEGPTRLLEAIDHARSAGTMVPSSELAAIADRAASTSLSVGDYESARQFLEFAHDIGISDAPDVQARRLCQLGSALDGLGLVTDARIRLVKAFEIAELNHDVETAIEAAIAYTLPVDWYAGDRRTTAILQRAEAMSKSAEHKIKVQAARAMAEMRIPISSDKGNQVAWVTRPSVAQPLSEHALAQSRDCTDDARLLSLLAWRTTHRDPSFLDERREVSSEAFDLAQKLRIPSRQVDAAVMLAVDALESADRPGFDHALTVLRWVAEVDGNPRLLWHAHAMAAGVAHLEGDVDAAEDHRHQARSFGISINSPGWFGADLLLLGQELLARRNHDEIRKHLPDDEGAELLNPLGKLIVGLGHCLIGDKSRATKLLRHAMRQFEREASWLLCLTRASELAIHLDDQEIIDELWQSLLPWHEHVAVDSQAWFCDGPVSSWLTHLAFNRGDNVSAHRFFHIAEPVARRLGDARTLSRLSSLHALDPHTFSESTQNKQLTAREQLVLQHMVDGLSNPQIAELLAYSQSTVRNDLSMVYRKLGVSTRAEAAAIAIRDGLAKRTEKETAN